MRHHQCPPTGRMVTLVSAALVGLTLSVVASSFAAADDPVGSPTPSPTVSEALSPSPTASPDPVVTPSAGLASASPSVVTTPVVTASPTQGASVTPTPAEQRSPSPEALNAEVSAAITVSGVLRDATTGAPIRNSCIAWRQASDTSTATNRTTRVSEKGQWSIDTGEQGPFSIAFYVTENGDCSRTVLTGSDNYRASWYRGRPFSGTNPGTALPPTGAAQVAAGSDIVACLGTQNALPTACTTPDRTVSGRVVGMGPAPIANACVLAIGPAGELSEVAVTDPKGRWKLSGLPINYDFVVAVIPPVGSGRGPCGVVDDGPPQPPPPGGLQPEFYDNTWVDLTDARLQDEPFVWATDPDSPHPAVAIRNNRTGINFCLTTETGRDTERSSCDPGTPTPAPTESATVSPSKQTRLAATGALSLVTPALGIVTLLGAVGLLAKRTGQGRPGDRR